MAEIKPEGPICASHTRQKWNIDKSIFDWHRWCQFEERPWLRWVIPIALTVVVVAIMIIGIVVTAEYYTAYYTSGTWLLHNEGNETMNPVTTQTSAVLGTADSVSSSPSVSTEEPIKVYGDQQHGCEKYNQPVSSPSAFYLGLACVNGARKEYEPVDKFVGQNICCSVGQACLETDFSASGVFCCGSSSYSSSGLKQAAVCPGHLYQCDSTVARGCRAAGSECSSIGCLLSATPIEMSFSGNATVTTTARVAATTYKYGEVAQSQGISQATTGVWSPFRLSGQPTCQAMKLVMVAVLVVWMVIILFH